MKESNGQNSNIIRQEETESEHGKSYGGVVDLLLNVPFVTPADGGYYICQVENEHGLRKQALKLEVIGKNRPAQVFTDYPGEYYLQESKDLKEFLIPCQVMGSPEPTLEWQILHKHKKINMSKHKIVDNGILLLNPSVEDSNIYVCIGKNKHGVDKVAIQVTIEKSVPIVETNVTKIEVEPNSFVAIECKIKNRGSRSTGVRTARNTVHNKQPLIWSRSSKKPWNQNFISFTENDTAVLTFKNIKAEDAGHYKCSNGEILDKIGGGLRMGSLVLADHLSDSTNSKIVEIIVKRIRSKVRILGPRKRFERSSSETEPGLNQEININCILEQGNPKPKIKWLFNDSKLSSKSSQIIIKHYKDKHTLKIKNPNKQNSGNYTCKATSPDYDPEMESAASVEIIVKKPPEIEISTLSNKLPSEIYYELDQNIDMACRISSGDYPIKLVWKFVSSAKKAPPVIVVDKLFEKEGGKSELILDKSNISILDSGLYTCSATNDISTNTKSIDVSVVGLPPNISIKRKHIKVIENTHLEIDCSINQGSYDSELQVSWIKPDLPDAEANKTMVESTKSTTNVAFSLPKLSYQDNRNLIFKKVNYNLHNGDYLCQAENSVGKSAKLITIDVVRQLEKPKILTNTRYVVQNVTDKSYEIVVEPGENIKFNCLSSLPEDEVDFLWLKNGVEYTKSANASQSQNELPINDLKKTFEITCRTKNLAGSTETKVKVVVLTKPTIKLSPKKVTVEKGDKIIFSCDVQKTTDKKLLAHANYEIDWFFGLQDVLGYYELKSRVAQFS